VSRALPTHGREQSAEPVSRTVSCRMPPPEPSVRAHRSSASIARSSASHVDGARRRYRSGSASPVHPVTRSSLRRASARPVEKRGVDALLPRFFRLSRSHTAGPSPGSQDVRGGIHES